ncbi:MAG: HNH endonuclease family protein [Nostoc sp.]|uniref:HNH endonuclease family protein n=1 Tax=Nostoc sp. TaxID=1180 RepID=UPI002FF07C62
MRQYVLLRLDSTLSQGEARYDYSIITVEHVLPQNPSVGSTWLQWFPNQEERIQYVHRIGNLALLSRNKNAEAQNYDFDKKKEKYFVGKKGISPFVLTTQVLQQSEWTPAVINQRQEDSLQSLRKIWRL